MGKTNIEIKIGDYIEGFEQIGPPDVARIVKTRLIVNHICNEPNGNKTYSGQADDSFRGARGTVISTEYGPIRLVTEEKPFTRDWWKEQIPDTNIIDIVAQNRAVIMTEDKKCILRGTAKTRYELCLVEEKSKRQIKEARGIKSAEDIVKYNDFIRLSDAVKEFYGTDSNLYREGEKVPKLIGVKARKILTIG